MRSRSILAVTAAVTAAGLIAPPLISRADAHFVLVSPGSWANQDAFGMPQKSAPCGQADAGIPAVPTNVVTTFQQGSTITVTIDEKVFHPGHYRVALATSQNALPADPTVTLDGAGNCGTTAAATDPAVLADNQLEHSTMFTTPQSIQVQLPAGMTCTNCTLQVVEFMAGHAPLCFYHHCAAVDITAAPPPDAGIAAGDAAGSGYATPGGCAVGGRAAASGLGLIALATAWLVRRRRARHWR